MSDSSWHNLISICYVGGTNGKAICRILEFSHDAYQYGFDSRPGPFGDLHHCASGPSHDGTSLNIFDFAAAVGLPYDPFMPFDTELAQLYREAYGKGHLPGGMIVDQVLESCKLVTADHMSAVHRLSIFPRSKIICLNGYLPVIIRKVADKWFLGPHPIYSDTSVVDHEMRSQDKQTNRQQYKNFFRGVMQNFTWIIQDNMRVPEAYQLDYERLFDPQTYEDTYHDLVHWCGLTPNWSAAKAFIDLYNDAQLDRIKQTRRLIIPG